MVLLSRFGHQWVRFRSSFSDSWLGSMGTEWEQIACERFEEFDDPLLVHLGPFVGIGEEVLPLPEGIDGALEADPFYGSVEADCGMLHETSDEVVSDGMHSDFLADHFRALASKHVHAEGGLDMAEEEFDLPSAQVECGELGGRIFDGVGKGRDHDEGSGSKAGDLDRDEDLSEAKCRGQFLPLGYGTTLRPAFGFLPADQSVAVSELLAFAQVVGSSLVEAHDRVGTAVE